MCEHTWDPNKTWGIYYWEELIPPLIVYRSDLFFDCRTLFQMFMLLRNLENKTFLTK